MPFAELERTMLVVPWVIWAGDIDNVDITPGSDVGKVIAPWNGIVRAAELRVPGGTGSSQLIMELFRAGGVGVGSAIVTSSSVAVASGGAVGLADNLEVRVSRGETLYIVARASDADTDDFTDVGFVLWANPLVN
jgi:hypothetical protein